MSVGQKTGRIVGLFIALLFALTVTAADVDVQAARVVAMAKARALWPGKLMSHEREMRLAYYEPSMAKAAMADYYVFNATDGRVFCIVAGDDRAPAVLAYGPGSIDMSALPCNCRMILDGYREQMEWLIMHPEAHVEPQGVQLESRDTTVVEPLLTCRWGQGRPYNLMCPLYNGSRCVTGCVATAMAQVMYYWRFPDELPPLQGYTTSTRRIDVPALPACHLAWADMLDRYIINQYTEEQADAVANLMRYCGQSCHMDYTPGQSAANSDIMTDALKTFGYNKSMTVIMRYNYGDSLWQELMMEELTAGRPILYHGANISTGASHAFVVDGFDGDKYHVNWGWDGLADGYFALNSFVSGFNDRHAMQFQCFPEGIDGVKPIHDFEANGIYYKITGNGVRVTNAPAPGKYSGQVNIPDMVDYQGAEYPVTEIAPSAFADCPDLTGVAIGGNVTVIDDEAFARSMRLTRVRFPQSLSRVHHLAFDGCQSLDTVEIGSLEAWCNIEFMGGESCPMINAHHLLLNGAEISRLVVPDGVTAISVNLFRNCDSLRSVVLPQSVISIGNYAFHGCKSLKTIQMSDALASVGYAAFAGCVALENIKLPPGLERIDRYAFRGCQKLKRLVVPDQVRMIGSYAFKDCKQLTHVTLGARLDTIGGSAFGSCTAIDTIVCRAPVPPALAARSCFHSTVYANAVLQVPMMSLEAYRHAEIWSLFVSTEGYDTSCGKGDINRDGELNMADVNVLIDELLMGPVNENTVSDVNGDGEVTIADVGALIDLIL